MVKGPLCLRKANLNKEMPAHRRRTSRERFHLAHGKPLWRATPTSASCVSLTSRAAQSCRTSLRTTTFVRVHLPHRGFPLQDTKRAEKVEVRVENIIDYASTQRFLFLHCPTCGRALIS